MLYKPRVKFLQSIIFCNKHTVIILNYFSISQICLSTMKHMIGLHVESPENRSRLLMKIKGLKELS